MKDTRKSQLKRQRELKRRQQRQQRQQRHQRKAEPEASADPIIGYVSRHGMNMACDGDACIVAGTREAMLAILQYHRRDPAQYLIEPARGSQILQVLTLGGAYAFDQEAYGRFLPEAQQAGLPLVEEDFSDPGPTGIHLVRVGFL
jgi:hypothetical protein